MKRRGFAVIAFGAVVAMGGSLICWIAGAALAFLGTMLVLWDEG